VDSGACWAALKKSSHDRGLKMAYGSKFECTVKMSVNELSNNLQKRLKGEGWPIIHTESFKRFDNLNVTEIMGVSSSFGGSTVLSFSMHGARSVPFFLKITENRFKNSADLLIITAGSQDIFEFDWGRNSKVGERLFEFCTSVPFKERDKIASGKK